MTDNRITLQPGWTSALTGTVLATATVIWVINTVELWPWLSPRLALGGLVLFVFSLVIGFQQGIGLATLAVLTATVFSADVAETIDWGRPLIIGCVWYVAAELAWDSIERRTDTVATPAIGQQRLREIATVVMVTILIGLAAAGASTLAPSRTLLLRALAVVAVVAALGAALARLNRSATGTGTAD